MLFFLYLWLRVRPELIYHGFGTFLDAPIFRFGLYFFEKHLSYPGGLLEYVSGFLSQCFYFSWLGALILTAVAWSFARCTASLISPRAQPRLRLVYAIPAILLLATYNNYTHTLTVCLGMLAALAFFITYRRIGGGQVTLGRVAARIAVFTVLFFVLYYITAAASLLFLVLVVVYEIFNARHISVGLSCLVIGLAVPWFVGIRLFGIGPVQAYLGMTPFYPGYTSGSRLILCALWLFSPVVVLLMGLGPYLTHPKTETDSSTAGTGIPVLDIILGKQGGQNSAESPVKADPRAGLQFRILILVAVLVCIFTFGRNRKNILQMNYFSRHKEWARLLETADRLDVYSIYSIHDIDRALYHTHRLGDEMFRYPQMTEALLLSQVPSSAEPRRVTSNRLLKITDICIELGYLNNSEHLACELLELRGAWPVFLEKLALINMARDDIPAARVYLEQLSRDLIYSGKAKRILAQLDSDPQLKSNVEVRYLREIMYSGDHPVVTYDWERVLEELLKTNKFNRMAFEYLMAYYMLSKNLERFVENLPRLEDFGYDRIPRHYQEAILIYSEITQKPVDLGKYRISEEIQSQYRRFGQICGPYIKDKATASRMSAPQFGDSYFFYFTFSDSGAMR